MLLTYLLNLEMCVAQSTAATDICRLIPGVIHRSVEVKAPEMTGKATESDGRLPPIAHVYCRGTVRDTVWCRALDLAEAVRWTERTVLGTVGRRAPAYSS